jgi:hypothetical protein
MSEHNTGWKQPTRSKTESKNKSFEKDDLSRDRLITLFNSFFSRLFDPTEAVSSTS